MGGHVGGALGRGLPGPAPRWVGRRARVLSCGSGSSCTAGPCARIPTSMAVEEEGLRVFQSVKIKIGEISGAGGDGWVLADLGAGDPRSPIRSWRCALPGRGSSPLPGDGRSRGYGENNYPRLPCAASGPKLPQAQCSGWGPLYVGGGAGQDADPVSAGSVCLCACLCVHECVPVCA